jgi:L-ribulose-5-phosphate 3-epimerase
VNDLPKITPYLAHVHLKDTTGGRGNWDFPALGTGTVDFGRVLEILEESGYEGPFSVELEFQGEPWPPLPEVTDSMRRSYEHLSGLGLG